MTKNFTLKQLPVAIALVASVTVPSIALADFSGNIGVASKYIFRGLAESDSAVLNGGLDYNHASGFYAGWWASSLGYGYDKTGATVSNGVENDFYAGFSGNVSGLSYDANITQFVYMNVDDSNQAEFNASLGYGPISVGMAYQLKDGWWGNQGDIYWTLGAEFALPKDFTISATAGFFTYEQDDNAKMCGGTAGCGTTTESSGFRNLDLTLSHPVGKTGADMSVTYVVGGDDRGGNKIDNSMYLGLSYGFDI